VGYNSVAGNRGPIFICLAVVVSPKSAKLHEIPRKLEIIAVQGHPRSSILEPIENFLLVTTSNYGRVSCRFRDIDA